MARPYENAEKLLPPDLLKEVQKYVGIRGCLLWVPGSGVTQRQKRCVEVLRLRDNDYPIAHIAMRTAMSDRTVRRILERYRKGKLHPNVIEIYNRLRAPSDTSAQEEQSNPEDHTRR
jgi:hypothetical protein